MADTPARARDGSEWDLLTTRLQALRAEVGEPSYAEIAHRVAERRLAAGRTPHEARVARTTVYDAFRTGRARINLDLVREIAAALGADEHQVDGWVAERRAAARAAEPRPASDTAPPPPEPPEPAPAAPRQLVVGVLLGCVLVNLAGRTLVDLLQLPVHLDMVGTAVAAFALGPWHGVLVAIGTCTTGTLVSGTDSLSFGVVNVVGALLWGYGVRRWDLGRTLARFLLLNVAVALVCTLVAVPVLIGLHHGSTGHGQDAFTATMLRTTGALAVAVALGNLLSSLGDKLISGFVALVLCSMLPLSLRARTPLALVAAGPAAGSGPLRSRDPG